MVAIFADSNRARIRFIKEDVNGWGSTPTTGVARELRYTSSSLDAQKDTTMSSEIRADRMVSEVIETGFHSQGAFNTEFSAGSHDDFMEQFMFGAWTRPMTFDSVKGSSLEWGTTAKLYVKGKDVSDYFFVGRRIKTEGFANPANNGYFQISAIAWVGASNRTEITVATTTSVAQKGSAYTRLYDANDVIVLNSTVIRAGTAGAQAFDSNGSNAFAAAIAAGQLQAGQRIFVEGLGFETGTVTFADGSTAPVAAGSKLSVSDGVNPVVTFQFGGSVPQGYVAVTADTDEAVTAQNLADAVNGQRVKGNLDVAATVAAGAVTLRNLNSVDGAITEVLDTGAAITVVAFSGGDATVRGVFTLDTVTDDVLTVLEPVGTNANAGSLKVTFKGSMLRNPADAADIVPQSISNETGFEDVGQFFVADGLRIGSWSQNIAANAIVTGTFDVQGRAMARSNVSKLGDTGAYTVLDSTSTPVANATTNVGVIQINGEDMSTALQSISFQATNNLRNQQAVGYKFPAGIGAGRMEISGSTVAYFADGSLFDKFLNHETVSLNFPIQDTDGNRYHFTFPAANFSTDTVNPSGQNSDIMENLNFMAKRDPVTDCQMQVDRFSSVLPV